MNIYGTASGLNQSAYFYLCLTQKLVQNLTYKKAQISQDERRVQRKVYILQWNML